MVKGEKYFSIICLVYIHAKNIFNFARPLKDWIKRPQYFLFKILYHKTSHAMQLIEWTL